MINEEELRHLDLQVGNAGINRPDLSIQTNNIKVTGSIFRPCRTTLTRA